MNILLQEWDLPPFDQIKIEDYEPAVRAAIDEAERNVEAIAANPEPPTFENTVEALEVASRRLDRVSAIMLNLNECCTTEQLQQVVMRMEPLMTRFSMQVVTDRRLYERVKKVADSDWKADSVEQETLLQNTLKSFVRNRVALPDAERNLRNLMFLYAFPFGNADGDHCSHGFLLIKAPAKCTPSDTGSAPR